MFTLPERTHYANLAERFVDRRYGGGHLTHDEATFDRALGEFTREHVQSHIDETDRADFEADCERVLDIFLAVWNGDMDDTP